MFLKVTANDVTMVLNLGTDLDQASKVIQMFENNAKFIQESYSSVSLLDSKQSIELGSKIEFNKTSYDNNITNIVITNESLDIGYVKAENNAFCDVDKIKADYIEKIMQMKKEIESLSAKNKSLTLELDELKEAQED